MKRIGNLLLAGLLIALAVSCADDSLDPLQFKKVKKGGVLALRGQQLENIYFDGKPGAELFPKIATGAERFDFDAEFVAEDPTTLESFDIFVIKRVGSTRTRVAIRNVPFSEFKTTDDYLRPWVSVSIPVAEIMTALDITFPLSSEEISTLLTTYKFGVNIEIDLNLTDGSKILAENLVAAGLFQSNQFYPAQKLNYAMTDYCAYDVSIWGGAYDASEVYENSTYGPYPVTLVPTGQPNTFTLTNFYDFGFTATVVFSPSSNPDTQIVTFPEQVVSGQTLTGSGTYNQCLGTFQIQTNYDGSDFRYELVKN